MAVSYETKLELITEIESLMRKCNTRCERHLIKLGYFCPRCQHGLCTVCNDIESRTQCPGSDRVQGRGRVDYQEDSLESETQNDSDDNGSNKQLSYGLKLRAADPRYITNGDDSNRGDMLLSMAQVRELISRKEQSEEGVATVWLTTAEMGIT